MNPYAENVPEIKSSNFQNLKLIPGSPWYVHSEYVGPIWRLPVEAMILQLIKHIQNEHRSELYDVSLDRPGILVFKNLKSDLKM